MTNDLFPIQIPDVYLTSPSIRELCYKATKVDIFATNHIILADILSENEIRFTIIGNSKNFPYKEYFTIETDYSVTQHFIVTELKGRAKAIYEEGLRAKAETETILIFQTLLQSYVESKHV